MIYARLWQSLRDSALRRDTQIASSSTRQRCRVEVNTGMSLATNVYKSSRRILTSTTREGTVKLRTKSQDKEIEALATIGIARPASLILHKVSATRNKYARLYSQSSHSKTTQMQSTTQVLITAAKLLRMEITTSRPTQTRRSIRKKNTKLSSRVENA